MATSDSNSVKTKTPAGEDAILEWGKLHNFDVAGARKAGYSDAEIEAHIKSDYLGKKNNFDVAGARKEGYSDADIITHLTSGSNKRANVQAEPEKSFLDTAGQWAGVTTRALAPYATAATFGAVAGAPAGGVGAVPGAAFGVTALGLSDLATAVYNPFARVFGGPEMQAPSETIRDMYGKVGVGRKPQTAPQRIYSAAVEGATGGGLNALSYKTAAQLTKNQLAKRVLNIMGDQAGLQATAGGSSSVGGQATAEMGGGPTAQLAASLAAGTVAGARAGRQPKPVIPSTEQLKAQAQQAYTAARDAGVKVSENALRSTVDSIKSSLKNETYDSAFHTSVNKALKILESRTKTPQDFQALDVLRRNIRDMPADPSEKRLLGIVSRKIDDLISNLSPEQVVGGDSAQATQALSSARKLWAKQAKSDIIDDVLTNADTIAQSATSPRDVNQALRAGFTSLIKSKNFSKFSPEEQKLIRTVSTGGMTGPILDRLAVLAPDIKGNKRWTALFEAGLVGAGHPLAGATMATTGFVSKAAANKLAQQQAARAHEFVRAGGAVARPAPNYPLILAPTVLQGLQAQDRNAMARNR